MSSSGGRTKDLVRKQLLWNIIYNFDFKIQSVERIFFSKSKEQFLFTVTAKN